MLRRAIPLIAALAVGAAQADYPEDDPADDLARIRDRIEQGQAAAAIGELEPLIKTGRIEADVRNLLGYAYRKMGDFAASRVHYTRALALDPDHKGALEYMGELELQIGDAPAARALLTRLRTVCPDGCAELDDLIAAFAGSGVPLEEK